MKSHRHSSEEIKRLNKHPCVVRCFPRAIKYTYEFKVDGDKITGKATFDHSMGKGETVLKDIKLSGDTLSFVEPMKINDAEVTISYTGKIAGDEIKLTRNVGDFGTEQLVAKRQKAPAAKAADGK